jgi:hypothetical protein
MNFGASRLGFWYQPQIDINWNLSTTGLVPGYPGGWYLGNNDKSITYIVQDSDNCGGPNPNVQTGLAIATFNPGASDFNFFYTLTGKGEPELPNFEIMNLYIDGGTYNNLWLVNAHAPGGDKGCAPAEEIVATTYVPPPLLLQKNNIYTFTLDFTTNDAAYHVGAFYTCTLNFARV